MTAPTAERIRDLRTMYGAPLTDGRVMAADELVAALDYVAERLRAAYAIPDAADRLTAFSFLLQYIEGKP